MTVIDAHQHFWDRGIDQFDHSWQEAEALARICRNFLPEDLAPLIQQAGVDQTVFVQTQHNLEENRWALQLADKHAFICGVVGWVDLASPKCESQLLEFTDDPRFVGIRHVVQDEADDDFILRDDVSCGLAILEKHAVPFDLLFFPKHLQHASVVARKFPNLPLVIDHLAKPFIKAGGVGEFNEWRRNLQTAADCDNVFCKLSGMVTEADWRHWKADDLRPFAETAIECFGPERLMFGSDWPVCELAATYRQVYAVATELVKTLGTVEQTQIMGGTAQRFYSL